MANKKKCKKWVMAEKHWATCSPFFFELRNNSCQAVSVKIENLKFKKLYICFIDARNVVSLVVFKFGIS